MAKLRPLHDRVIVKERKQEQQTTPGGLLIPDIAREKPQEGEVLAVGDGKIVDGERIPLDVRPGDVILYGKYSAREIKVDGESYLIIAEGDIDAVVLRDQDRQSEDREITPAE